MIQQKNGKAYLPTDYYYDFIFIFWNSFSPSDSICALFSYKEGSVGNHEVAGFSLN